MYFIYIYYNYEYIYIYLFISLYPHDIAMCHHHCRIRKTMVSSNSASLLGVVSPSAASHGVTAPAAGLQRRECHRSVWPGALATGPVFVRDGDLGSNVLKRWCCGSIGSTLELRLNGDSMGFNGDLMGLYCDLMGIYGIKWWFNWLVWWFNGIIYIMVLNGDSMVVNGHFPVTKIVNFPILNLVMV